MENSRRIESKSSINEIFDQSSCAFCKSMPRMSYADSLWGSCAIHPSSQIKESIYSSVYEASRKQKLILNEENNQTQWIPECVKEKEERRDNKAYGPEQCFMGSSVYYGGPDELYYIHEEKKPGKQLEQAMDPFFPKYTTRGNWWEGSYNY
ncbi:uncharacterized protein LOC131061190 [Cryptomeria japonica]|uniref:uncharacterized protein LOC131061190 n=1 Tax=Cryptomeria japonica TaxID=3369 RepID=UPI0025AC28D6|nr:uncharacterized protein LOC131061190 [Cryptomeria japonica]